MKRPSSSISSGLLRPFECCMESSLLRMKRAIPRPDGAAQTMLPKRHDAGRGGGVKPTGTLRGGSAGLASREAKKALILSF